MSAETDIEEVESDHSRSFRSLTEAFINFLLPAVHTILYLRDIYPSTSFLPCRAYEFPVYQSRHPAVCAWIADAVASVKRELVKGLVRRIALVIIHPQTLLPLERYVWDVYDWHTEADYQHVETDENEDASSAEEDAASEAGMDEQMRALLSRLAQCKDRLIAIPPGCTFTLTVELRAGERAVELNAPTWVTCSSSQRSLEKATTAEDQKSLASKSKTNANKIFPLPAVEAGEMNFEMWIEEAKGKLQSIPKT